MRKGWTWKALALSGVVAIALLMALRPGDGGALGWSPKGSQVAAEETPSLAIAPATSSRDPRLDEPLQRDSESALDQQAGVAVNASAEAGAKPCVPYEQLGKPIRDRDAAWFFSAFGQDLTYADYSAAQLREMAKFDDPRAMATLGWMLELEGQKQSGEKRLQYLREAREAYYMAGVLGDNPFNFHNVGNIYSMELLTRREMKSLSKEEEVALATNTMLYNDLVYKMSPGFDEPLLGEFVRSLKLPKDEVYRAQLATLTAKVESERRERGLKPLRVAPPPEYFAAQAARRCQAAASTKS